MPANEATKSLDTQASDRPKTWARSRFWRRRRFIIDPRFQGGLLAAFMLQLLAFTLVLSIGLFLPPIIILHTKGADAPEMLAAARQVIALDSRYWPALGGAFVLVVLLAIRTSHKIAGPLYRFRRVFEAVLRSEDPGPVRLRRGDYLIPEANFLDRVVRKVSRDRRRLADFERQTALLLRELDNEPGVEAEFARNLVRRRLVDLLSEEVDS